jgi:hypothetical protein
VNHAAIDAAFPPGTRQRNVGAVFFDNPDRDVAWSRQYSLGYERQIGANFAVSVDYIRSEQRQQYTQKDLNPALRNSTLATGAVTRTNPLVGSVGEFVQRVNTITNDGWIDYSTVQVSGTKRYSRGLMARISYAYSKGEGNTPTGQNAQVNSQYLDDLRLDTEIGPTDVDRPHILSISGSYDVPRTTASACGAAGRWTPSSTSSTRPTSRTSPCRRRRIPGKQATGVCRRSCC